MVALALTIIAALAAAPSRGPAQPTPGVAAESEWTRPEEVPVRADAMVRGLEAAQPDAAAQSLLAEIEKSLPQLERDLDALVRRATYAVDQSITPTDLEDIRRELQSTAAPLADWKDKLATEAGRVADDLDLIARGQRSWLATRARPETAAAGDVVVQRVESSIAALSQATASLSAWRARVLSASDRVLQRIAGVDATAEKLGQAIAGERASLFHPDSPPLWSRGLGAAIRRELPRVGGEIAAYAASTTAYIAREPRPLVVQGLMAALLMLGLGRFSAHARRRLAGEQAATRAVRLLERPHSIGLLIALLTTAVFHPLAPRRLVQLLAMIALVPTSRILTHVVERVQPMLFAPLFVLLVLDRLVSALRFLPALDRVAVLSLLAIGLAFALWLSRRATFGSSLWRQRVANLAAAGLTLALLAEVGGWTRLSEMLGRGIMASAISAIYVYAAAIALAALVAYALASRTVRRSNLIGRNTALLQRRVERGLWWLGACLWLYMVATALGLRGAAGDALSRVLNAGVAVGALSLSVGGVLAFLLTLVAALLLARIATAVLEEDVFPRTQLPLGVPYALSTLVRYGIYVLGGFFALAAAGVQLGQVTIMVGGLGIGIGLGLQDLVKNFAAGLTLLFERRLRVGDAVEIASLGIVGRVLSIGTRASVVRTWRGAEVVVPNADLVSSAVTNWTLSDRFCRIEVSVGVAYGSDPGQVIALLLAAVRSVDGLVEEPAADALFKGFGESSLDFVVRAWTGQGYESMLGLTSELALAINRRLDEAAIAIPFPQRDVHLTTASPPARALPSAPSAEDGDEPDGGGDCE